MTAFSTGLVVDWPHKEKALVRKVAHTARLVRCRTPIFIFLPVKPVIGLVMSTPAPRRVCVTHTLSSCLESSTAISQLVLTEAVSPFVVSPKENHSSRSL